MEKFLCTNCGKTTSLAKCPDCGRGTIPNLPISGSMRPLQTVKQRYPTNIPKIENIDRTPGLFKRIIYTIPSYLIQFKKPIMDYIKPKLVSAIKFGFDVILAKYRIVIIVIGLIIGIILFIYR